MKTFKIIFLQILISLTAFTQEGSIIIEKAEGVNPWSNLDLNNNPDNFQFAIVTDRTGGHRPGVFLDGVNKLNLLQPEFVMSVGDLIEGYTRDKDEIYQQWDEFNGFISKLQMPFFYVPGNHDYINDVMADIWAEKFGRSYYHFIYKDVLFLCLNSEEATKGSNMGGIEKQQYKFIEKVLENNPDVKWTLVFMHQPLWILDNTRYWPEVEKLLNDRKHTVFVGHHHHYVKYERNNGKYFMLATTGGVSRLRGPDFGEFDHLVWVTMTENGPVIANLLLDGIWDENVVTEDVGRMINNSPVKFEPILFSDSENTAFDLTLKLFNDENIPMDFDLKLDGLENFKIDKNVLTGTVPPNNVKVFSIKLEPLNLRNDKLKPIKLSGNIMYKFESGRIITLKQSLNYTPSFKYSLPKTTNTMSIDGIGDEWLNVNSVPIRKKFYLSGDSKAYTGKEDLDMNIKVACDENYLYAFAEIKDDHLFHHSEKSVWNQDAFRFYVDARPLSKSIAGKEIKNGDDYIGLFFSAAEGDKNEMIVYQKDNFPEGTRYFARKSDNAITYEMAIPITWIKEKSGENWKTLRMNFAVNDVDDDGAVTRIFWMPEWRSENNIIGTGIFSR